MTNNKDRLFSIYIRILFVISLVILTLTIIPMILIGFSAQPLGDDFFYGVPAMEAIRSGRGLFGIISAAFKGTAEQYMIWQGTYSAMFLMHLPPQLAGETLYGFYPAVILTLFTGSIFYLVKPLIRRDVPDRRKIWVIISALIASLCIQFVPLCGETFYWFNGSFYYTGFLSLTLYFFGFFIRYRRSGNKLLLVISIITALFVAGGNYASLLPAILILCLILLNDLISKNKKMLLPDILNLTAFLIGIAVSILAPGNALRQATSYGATPVKAVVKSILQCSGYVLHWTVPFFFLTLILLLPIAVYIIRNSDFKFKYPLPVCLIVFGIYCSSECPTFYAQNNGGAARVFDICYYMMIFTVCFISFYALGGMIRFIEKKKEEKTNEKSGLTKLILLCCAGLTIICIVFSIIRPSVETFMPPNSVTATVSLVNGEASYYSAQYLARYELIRAGAEGDVTVPPIDVPERLKGFLNCGDISPDPASNEYIAEYYGLNSIQAVQP